jgi:hypothetical protein
VIAELASVRGRDSGGRDTVEASNLSVAPGVENQGEELAGDCDAGLVLASALGDPFVIG